MARVDALFDGVVGQGSSLKSNSGEMLNCHLELNAAGEPRIVGRPGQKLLFTLPNSPVRGCFSDTGISYWVAGNGVYKRNEDNSINHLGNISTYNGSVMFASSGIDLMIVDGTAGWAVRISTGVLTQITAPAFPANPVAVVYTHGFFVVTVKAKQQFFVSSQAFIATLWNALDFATAEGNPDNLMGMQILNDELFLFGFKTVEVWGFSGNADFPFQRNTSATIDHGIIAANSVGKGMDSLIWLGGDNIGQGMVWQLVGYQVSRISTHEIEQKIAKMAFIGDAFSIVFQMQGHVFYILQFPSANQSLYYNMTTGLWGTLSYNNQLTGEDDLYRASCSCFSGSRNLVGDTQSGKVFELRNDVYTDDGSEIVLQHTFTVQKLGQKEIFYKELIIDMETGVGNNLAPGNDPKIGLSWSNDGGHTWSVWRFTTMGKIGQYWARAYWDMLGVGRNRTFRIRITDPVQRHLIGSVMNAEAGTS